MTPAHHGAMLSRLHRCTPIAVAVLAQVFVGALAAQNRSPNAPRITEPGAPFARLSPYDVHMESAPFADPDPGDVHAGTQWEIWTATPSQRVWSASIPSGPGLLHVHLGDGAFEASHAGWTNLFPAARFTLRVRHRDDSGDPNTEWSSWATTVFDTLAIETPAPLALDDIAADPAPRWLDTAGVGVELSTTGDAFLQVDQPAGGVLLRIDPRPGAGNRIANPAAVASHAPLRVILSGGTRGNGIDLPETDLEFAERGCDLVVVRLPRLRLLPGMVRVFWVNLEGATYVGSLAQSSPVFTSPARGLRAPFVMREPGYVIDVVAEGLRLPMNLAFAPRRGSRPGDPSFYVSELYGTIRCVTNDGSLLTYAANLLNYTPNGAFPGEGEQGLTGIAVDPVSGDVFAAMLARNQSTNLNDPRIVRFSSVDGGRTASSSQVILSMTNEPQGQSHQISCLEIVNGMLFCHMGDGFDTGTARDLSSYRGKILRMNLDGSPVTSNPFYDGGLRNSRDYIFAYGVRNPFGGAWRAADGARYMVENGPSVDRFAKLLVGRDYRWTGSDNSMRNFALYNWDPARGPVNLAFVQPETFGGSGFPTAKQGHAFVSESGPTYALGRQSRGKRITEFVLDAAGNLVSGPVPFVEYVGDGRATIVGLAAGPDGLYFTELYRDLSGGGPTATGGRVLRIRAGDPRDCNANGEADDCEIAAGLVPDCNRNGIPDSCDLRDGRSTDFDANGIPDDCDPLRASTDQLTVGTPGRVDFALTVRSSLAGLPYALIGSGSGTLPGTALGSVHVPLNLANDAWFTLSAMAANSPTLIDSIGVFDARGEADAALVLTRAIPPTLAGLVLHHAFVVLDPASADFVFASNAVPLRLR